MSGSWEIFGSLSLETGLTGSSRGEGSSSAKNYFQQGTCICAAAGGCKPVASHLPNLQLR